MMSGMPAESSALSRYPCRYQGHIEIDKRYNFPSVMPWLLAEVKKKQEKPKEVSLNLVGSCLECTEGEEKLYSHRLSHIRRFIKSKSFPGLVAYIHDPDGGTNMELHAFMMNRVEEIDKLYEDVQRANLQKKSNLTNGNDKCHPVTSTPTSSRQHGAPDVSLGNIHTLLNRGYQVYEVLYLGTVRLRKKTVENFDDIIQQVYSCLHTTSGNRARHDSSDPSVTGDVGEDEVEEVVDEERCRRRQRLLSNCSVGGESWDSSRNGLLVIGASGIRLFNIALRQLHWERHIRDVASILSSYHQADHIGLVAESEPESVMTHGEGYRYALYIFQCASKEIATSTFSALKRTFLSCQDARRLCDLCPINLFNRLCDRMVGVAAEEVNTVIAEHILQMDTKDTDAVEQWMRNCDADSLETKNEMLIALIRRMSSDKQQDHLHVRSASELDFDDKKADLLTRAKNTFFSSLKREKSSSSKSLHTTSMKKLSTGSEASRFRSQTSIGVEHYSVSDTSEGTTLNKGAYSSTKSLQNVPAKKLSTCSDSFAYIKSEAGHGRENWAVVDATEVYGNPPDVTSPLPTQTDDSFDFPPESRTEGATRELHRMRSSTVDGATLNASVRRTHASGDHLQESKVPLRRRRSNSGGSSDLNDTFGRRHSMRYKIFSTVVSTPRRPESGVLDEEDDADELSTSLGSSTIRLSRLRKIQRSRDRYRALWKKAISEIRMLIRMEKKNHVALHSNSGESHLLLLGLQAYEDMPSGLSVQCWSKLRDSAAREEVLDAVQIGVPRGRRADAWRHLMRTQPNKERELYSEEEMPYEELIRQLTIHQHAIIIDIGRTFPSHPMFADPEKGGQLALFNILKAYSLHDKEIGYCQGISFIAGVLLMHMPEKEAFETLKFIMYVKKYRLLFTPDMSHLQVCLYQFSRLLHDHLFDLHQHFESLNVSSSYYATPWLLTMFATQFSVGFVARAFDLFLVYGTEAIFRIGLSLLTENAAQLTQCSTFETACDYLRSVLPTMSSVSATKIFDQAFREDLSQDLHTYAIEYRVLNEEVMAGERSSHDYSRRLQDLNRELARQKRELSTRYEVAERVVGSQRTEIASLRQELSTVRADMKEMWREGEELRNLVAQLRDALLRGCPDPGEVLGEKLAIQVAAALS